MTKIEKDNLTNVIMEEIDRFGCFRVSDTVETTRRFREPIDASDPKIQNAIAAINRLFAKRDRRRGMRNYSPLANQAENPGYVKGPH